MAPLSKSSDPKPRRRMPVSRCRADGDDRPFRLANADQRSSSSLLPMAGLKAVLDVVGRIGGRLETVQYVNFRLRRQQAASGNPLAEMRDEEGSRAGGPEPGAARSRPIP